MKKTIVAVFACTLLSVASLAYAGETGVNSGTGPGAADGMSTGRASATEENNNQPGTTAGTPTHSVPANSANTGTSNLFNSGR